MDFDERYRGEMIRYATERYGADRVAQIVTFSTIKARAAVRDAARVLGLPVSGGRPDRQGHAAAHHGPRHAAAGVPRPHRGLRRRLRHGPGAARHVRHRRRGPPRHRRGQGPRGPAPPGRHPRRGGGHHQGAAHRVPAHPAQARERRRTRAEAPIVTQYEMHGVEELGLLKMDFLGLRNLSVIERALDLVEPRPRASAPTSTPSPSTTRPPSPCCSGPTRSASSSSRGAPCARIMRALAPTVLRRRGRPGGAVPARAHGRQHAPRLPGAEERAQGASATSTPTWRPSWATPTGS